MMNFKSKNKLQSKIKKLVVKIYFNKLKNNSLS